MGILHNIVNDVELPKMFKVKQIFNRPIIEDVAAATLEQLSLEKIRSTIKPGMHIAITAGSRGIANCALIIKTIVDFAKSCGAHPFVIPAMGSHGGATAQGQLQIINDFGITEEYLNCPIISSMETVNIGQTQDGQEVFIDKHAANADGIIVFGRIKPHTAFRGTYESGIMKMMAIGLGKLKGAQSCHNSGFKHMAKNVPMFGNVVRTKSNVLFGLATIENSYDETCKLVALTNEEIPLLEPELLLYSAKLLPRIIIPKGDVLIVDYIGKNFSGDGQDPNITGSFITPYASGGFEKQRTVFLDVSPESHGSTYGLGMADFITKRLLDKSDHEKSIANGMTAITIEACKIPIAADNHCDAIKAAIKVCTEIDKSKVKIVRIANTLHLGEIWLSEAMLEQAKEFTDIEILSEPQPFAFDNDGNLFK